MRNRLDYELISRWILAMLRSPRTQITLANLKFDYSRRRIRLKPLLRVAAAMLSSGRWTNAKDGPDDAESAIENTLNGADPSLFGHGPPVRRREGLSNIVDHDVMRGRLVRCGPSATVVDRKPELSSTYETILPEHVRETAAVRGRRSVAWVTDTGELQRLIDEELRKSGDPPPPQRIATRVRNFLGLSGKDQRHHLFELQYPDSIAQALTLSAPTVVEGACAAVYRSNDVHPDGWGFAVDLETLQNGGVEAVHAPVPFTAEFRVRYLGPVTDRHYERENDLAAQLEPWNGDADLPPRKLKRRPKK